MRFRRARTLVITYSGSTVVLQNFLTQVTIPCDDFTIGLLARADTWKLLEELGSELPNVDRSVLGAYVDSLADQSFLVVEGSQRAELDHTYEDSWAWDVFALGGARRSWRG